MKLDVDPTDLRPLVQAIIAEVLSQAEQQRDRLGGRLAYTEPEAAALLGVRPHVLRDARRRGELEGRMLGKRIVYSRAALLRFLDGEGGA